MGRLPGTAALRLENIALSDSLPGHLKNWYGGVLTLVLCDGVNDEFLDMLGSVSTFSGAPNLTKLTIVDCPNFTWEALKKMVEARGKAKKGAIEDLIVRGRGPTIDADEASWLKGQLKSLEWDTWV
ncbi:hypothetical protein BDZ94DRAFT_986211 [Collybia nuda]|uniref:Uncharacterized protein n=1 Tax=Collybia nuda TaxID=64659 RepID=A0A9P6CBH8_9AGAR|nr:hypothetical protein BDZ94DRAFT_986211 [Collybia nuda]